MHGKTWKLLNLFYNVSKTLMLKFHIYILKTTVSKLFIFLNFSCKILLKLNITLEVLPTETKYGIAQEGKDN